jgi:hypothetical protein
LAPRDSAEFKRALATHFPRLGELQARAIQLARTLGGRKPVVPDLWLVVNGEHRFIEVKLAKDEVAPHQFAGLALLAKCLLSEKPVSVTLVNLDSSTDQFNEYAFVPFQPRDNTRSDKESDEMMSPSCPRIVDKSGSR